MFLAFAIHAVVLGCVLQTTAEDSGPPDPGLTPSVATPSSGVTIDTEPPAAGPPLTPQRGTRETADAPRAQAVELPDAESVNVERASSAESAPAEAGAQLRPRPTPVRHSGAPPAEIASPARAWYRSSLLALAGVLGLILMVTYLLRRYVPAVRALGGGVLTVVQRAPLSSKQSIALVQVGRRMILIGITPEHITSLSVIDEPEECARLAAQLGKNARRSEPSFDAVLSKEAERFDREPVEASIGRADGPARLRDTRGHLEGMLKKLREMRVE